MSNLREEGKETIHDSRAEAEHAASAAKKRLNRAAQEARLRGQQTMEDATDWVRKHPAPAVGLALLAGSALGAAVLRVNSRRTTLEARYTRYLDASNEAWILLRKGIDEAFLSARKAVEANVEK